MSATAENDWPYNYCVYFALLLTLARQLMHCSVIIPWLIAVTATRSTTIDIHDPLDMVWESCVSLIENQICKYTKTRSYEIF